MNKLKIGVFGTKRGFDLAKNFMMLNCDIVALCDFDLEMRAEAEQVLGTDVALYESFDEFIEHDMDAVILANYFHEHAPYAIRCLERGIHVYSECISNGTLAEGVELLRAAEQSNAVYLLAENYPQMKFNLEMQRICAGGTLGRILFAEGEYNHPRNVHSKDYVASRRELTPTINHWRNTVPKTYYVTHSLGPLMRATGATPTRVTAYNVFNPNTKDIPSVCRTGDSVSIMVTQNNDGSVFRFTGHASFGAHDNSYRICGTKGQVENVRGMGDKVLLRYNDWDVPEGKHEFEIYEPQWNDPQENLIKASGHGGSDLLTARMFIDCIREGKQPEFPFDVHSAVTMSAIAILAHRSMMDGNVPYDIPDFRKEEERIKYENDLLTPFYGTDGSEPTLPCCSHPDHRATDKQLELFRKLVLKEDI